MSRAEIAAEKCWQLNESRAEPLLERLGFRENGETLRWRLDEGIGVGLDELKRGEWISCGLVHAEIRERSQQGRAGYYV